MQRVITTSEVAVGKEGDRRIRVKGFLISIEPPVNINPQVIHDSITTRKVHRPTPEPAPGLFRAGTVIGSTEDRTVIYAGLVNQASDARITLERARIELSHTFSDLFALLALEEPEIISAPPIYTEDTHSAQIL